MNAAGAFNNTITFVLYRRPYSRLNCSLVKPVWWSVHRLKRPKEGQPPVNVSLFSLSLQLALRTGSDASLGLGTCALCRLCPRWEAEKDQTGSKTIPGKRWVTAQWQNVRFVKMMEMQSGFVPQDGGRVLSGPKVMKRPCQRWLKGKTYHSFLTRLVTSWALVRRERGFKFAV